MTRWAALLAVLALAGCDAASQTAPSSAPQTPAASAPASPPPDALFYTKAGSLYVSAPPGSPGRKLTDGPADAQPAPSPDLSRVAFVRKAAISDVGGELWVLDLSAQLQPTGPPRRLVDPGALPPGLLTYPRWSPAGERIAFLDNRTEGMVAGGTLLVADADTGALAPRPPRPPETAWAPFAEPNFAWAPDGSRIAWRDHRSDVRPTNVNALDAATGRSAPLATGTNASSVTFTADSQTVLFTNGEAPPDFPLRAGGIYSVPASDAAGPPSAVFTATERFLDDLAVLDSGAVAFTSSVPNRPGTATIQVLDQGSATPRTVVSDLGSTPVCVETPQGAGVCLDVPHPAWGAGDTLAYLDNSEEPALVVTDSGNRSPQRVDTGVQSFAWAPR